MFSNEDTIKNLESHKFDEDSMRKFTDPSHPLYEDYKDREGERLHDSGWNNAIDMIINMIGRHRTIITRDDYLHDS